LNARRVFTDRRSQWLLAGTVVLTVACLLIVHRGVRAADEMAREAQPRDLPEHRELSIVRVDTHRKLDKTSWGRPEPVEPPEAEPIDEKQAEQGRHFQGIDLADVKASAAVPATHAKDR
jgi:hypothetical protein